MAYSTSKTSEALPQIVQQSMPQCSELIDPSPNPLPYNPQPLKP